MLLLKCHSIFIWCLVIDVINGNPISIENSENKITKTDRKENAEEEWDEDPYRWDEEVQVVNPSSLILSNNVSVEAPHFEPLVAAIDFGRNDFGEGTSTDKTSSRNAVEDVEIYNSLSFGDKISPSNQINKNRRRKVQRNKDPKKDTKRKRTRGLNRLIGSKTKSRTTVQKPEKNEEESNIISDIKWSSSEEKANNILGRNDIKNEEHLKNHRLNSFDSSYEFSKLNEWPDIYNMFPDIETSEIEFQPGLFIDQFDESLNHFNERIDEDFGEDDYSYDYKDYPFEKIDIPSQINLDEYKTERNDFSDDQNVYIDLEKNFKRNKDFVPSVQIDPLFVPSKKIPFDVDRNFLSEAIEYTEKPKTDGVRIRNQGPNSPWKLSFQYPPSISPQSSSFSSPISNSLISQDWENPIDVTKNKRERPRFPLKALSSTPTPSSKYKISSSTLRYKDEYDETENFVVSSNQPPFPSKEPNTNKEYNQSVDPIANKVRQNTIPPPPSPPARPKQSKKKIDFRVGFNKLRKMIRSIKLRRRRRRRFRKNRPGDGKRRKRKLLKQDVKKIKKQEVKQISDSSLFPYLKAPGLPKNSSNDGARVKRRRKLRRKKVGQRRMDEERRKSTSLAQRLLDGINRVARFSSEIILYSTLVGLT